MNHGAPWYVICKRRTRRRVALAWAVSLGLHVAGLCWLGRGGDVEPVKYGVDAGDQTLTVMLAGTATELPGPAAETAEEPPKAVAAIEETTPDEPAEPLPAPTPVLVPAPTPAPVASTSPVQVPAATPAPDLPRPEALKTDTRLVSEEGRTRTERTKRRAASVQAKGAGHSANTASNGSPSVGGGGILMRMGAQGAPNYLRNPAPEYPRQARMSGQEGTVILRVKVDPQGVPSEVRVSTSSGFASLDDSAETTVRRKWRFKPAAQAGRPIAADVLIPIRFAIKDYRQISLR